jgi:hypothetical protein
MSAIWEAALRRRAGCRAAPRRHGRAFGPQPIWRRSACGRTRHAGNAPPSHPRWKQLSSLTGFLPHQLDLKNDLDIRAPSLHTGARTWVTDYVVGCHASEESGLSVLVGSNEHVSPHVTLFHSHASTSGATLHFSGTRTFTIAHRPGH